jgi:hypothetical protein
VILAMEVLGTWREVAGQTEMADVRDALLRAADRAVVDAAQAAARMGVQPVFV